MRSVPCRRGCCKDWRKNPNKGVDSIATYRYNNIREAKHRDRKRIDR